MNEPLHPEIVLTSYFSGVQDPQRARVRYAPNDFSLMQVWYQSLHEVGLHGVIFHNECSEEFVQQYQSKNLRFVKHAFQTKRSPNDERFYAYRDFLSAHTEIEKVFMLDLFDAEFKKDPFRLMETKDYDWYCGGWPGVKSSNHVRMARAFGRGYYLGRDTLHAGTCGGPREKALELLNRMIEHFDDMSKRKDFRNHNMAVYNKCVYDLWPVKRILYGNPLNSRLFKEETDGNFCIRHK